MQGEVLYLLEIVKWVLSNQEEKLSLPDINLDWKRMLMIAERHNILNMVYYAVESPMVEVKLEGENYAYLRDKTLCEIARCYNQIKAQEELVQTCEAEGVCTLFVKGVSTKSHYPTPDMRTMGDIDFLYKPEQHKQLKQTMKYLGYTDYQEGRKNDTYFREPYICVEAHRQLVSPDSEYFFYYENIWSQARLKVGCTYSYELTVEDELIFNIVHLAEHFKEGGAGIRFIMDVYVYNRLKLDRDYILAKLKGLKLLDFYTNISRLAEYWFGDGKPDMKHDSFDLMEQLEKFILSNGVFGNREDSANLAVSDGKLMFVIKICFPSYVDMCSMFPWLSKMPFLLPFSWLLRAVRSLIYRKNNVQLQFKALKNGNQEKGKALRKFYKQCGL